MVRRTDQTRSDASLGAQRDPSVDSERLWQLGAGAAKGSGGLARLEVSEGLRCRVLQCASLLGLPRCIRAPRDRLDVLSPLRLAEVEQLLDELAGFRSVAGTHSSLRQFRKIRSGPSVVPCSVRDIGTTPRPASCRPRCQRSREERLQAVMLRFDRGNKS